MRRQHGVLLFHFFVHSLSPSFSFSSPPLSGSSPPELQQAGFRFLCCSSERRLVEELSVERPALQFAPEQGALARGTLHEAAVLLCTA